MVTSLDAAYLSSSRRLSARRWRLALLTALVLALSLGFAVLTLVLQIVSVVVLLTWVVLLAIAWRPLVGLSVCFGLVLLFEAGGADSLMLPGLYLHGGLGSTLGLSGVSTSPLELLLLLTFFVWLAQGAMRHRLAFRGGHLAWPMFLFLLALIAGLVRGIAGGGNVNVALWESRFLFYTVICYFVAANTVRTYRHLTRLITIVLVASGAFAIEGAYRRVALIDSGALGVVPEFAYSHEDVIFLGTLILLVLALWVFGGPLWQRLVGLLLVGIGGFTLLASERRAGYIAIIVAFLVYALVFVVAHRKAFFTVAVPLLIGLAIYLPIFWNDTSMLGQPARAIRSLTQPDPRDAASNLYRDLEVANVRYTIHANPILGVGFGREFDFIIPLPDLSWWPFWHYEPHHNILWVWLKLGTAGFIVFWTLMGSAIARATFAVRALRRPEARVFALLTLSGLVTTLVFCYVDLGLVSGRVTIFLGTTMGALSVLDQLRD